MFESLTIDNVQSHRHSHLELSDGVTAIIGPSDYGKSTVIRVIRALYLNKLSKAHRSKWGGDSVISVRIDGVNITKKKTDKDNTYNIDNKVYEAFGKTTPEDISEILNINDINIQRQHDAPFLLSETNGEIARAINKVAGLDKIDIAQKAVNLIFKDNNDAISEKKLALTFKKRQLQVMPDVNSIETSVKKLEETHSNLISISVSIELISTKIKEIDALEEEISLFPDYSEISVKIDHLIKLHQTYSEDERKFICLQKLVNEITELDRSINCLSNRTKHKTSVAKLLECNKILSDLEYSIITLEELISEIQMLSDSMLHYKKKITTLEKEFKKIFPNVCPLCKTNLQQS